MYFRKLLTVVLARTMLGTVGCKDYDDDIDSINQKIDQIEKVKLPGIEEQIGKVQQSIPDISALTASVSELQKNVKDLDKKLADELKTIGDKLAAVEATAKDYSEQKGTFAKSSDITTLRTDLERAVSKLSGLETKDTNLENAIKDLTSSDKLAWQGKTFDEYVASLGYVKTAYSTDKAQQAVLDAITKDNENYNAEYVAALVELVKNAEVTSGKETIKVSDLAARQSAYKKQMDALELRVAALEVRIDELIGRIQSIQYVPEFADGKATVAYSKIGSEIIYSNVVMTYDVRPADKAEVLAGALSNNPAYVSFIFREVAMTRAEAPAPALTIAGITADKTKGTITVTAKPENFDAAFVAAAPQDAISYSAALKIEVPATDKGADDKVGHADSISRTTAYTNLAPKAEMVLEYALKDTTEGSTKLLKEGETLNLEIAYDNVAGIKPFESFEAVYADSEGKTYTDKELQDKGYATAKAFTGATVKFEYADASAGKIEAADNATFAITSDADYKKVVVAMQPDKDSSVKDFTATGAWDFSYGEGDDAGKLAVTTVIKVGKTTISRSMTDQTAVWNYKQSVANTYDSNIDIFTPVLLVDGKLSTEHASFNAMLDAFTQAGGTPKITVTAADAPETTISDAVIGITAKGSGADEMNIAKISLNPSNMEWGKTYKVVAEYEFDAYTYIFTANAVKLDGLSQKEFTYTIPAETLTIAKGTGNVEKTYNADALYTANKTVIDKYFGDDEKGTNAQLNFSQFLAAATATPTAEAKTKETEPKAIALDGNTKLSGEFATIAPAAETPFMQLKAVIAADDVAKVGVDNAITYKTVFERTLNGQKIEVTANFVAKLALPEIAIAVDPASVANAKLDGTYENNVYKLSKDKFPSTFYVTVAKTDITYDKFAAEGIELVYSGKDAEVNCSGILTYTGKAQKMTVSAEVKYHGIETGKSASIEISQPQEIFKKIEYKTAAKTYDNSGSATFNLDKNLLSVTDWEGSEMILTAGDGSAIFAQITTLGNNTAGTIYGASVTLGTPTLTLEGGQTSPSLKAKKADNYGVSIIYAPTSTAKMVLTIPVTIQSKNMADQTGSIVINLTAAK